jgi:hypothetical protein
MPLHWDPGQEFPSELIDGLGQGGARHYQNQSLGIHSDFLNQLLGELNPLPGPSVALLVAAGFFRTGNQKDQIRPRLHGPQEMKRFDAPAAGQWEKFDSRTQFFFQHPAVKVLGRIDLLAEKNIDIQIGRIGTHKKYL